MTDPQHCLQSALWNRNYFYGSGSTSLKVTVPTVPVPQRCLQQYVLFFKGMVRGREDDGGGARAGGPERGGRGEPGGATGRRGSNWAEPGADIW